MPRSTSEPTRVQQNQTLSKILGWTPADFDRPRFDAELLAAIEKFQDDHYLDVTGVCDRMTWDAVLALRKAMQDAEPDRRAAIMICGLGSVSRYPVDHPAVVRSAIFTGRLAWADTMEDVFGVPASKADSIAVPESILAKYDLNGFRSILRWKIDADRPWTSAIALAQAAGDLGPAGVAVEIDAASWGQAVASGGKILRDFLDALEPRCDLPRLVRASPETRRGTKTTQDEQETWATCRRFDVASPTIPGRYRSAPEARIGRAVKEWSIYGKIRPAFCFPTLLSGKMTAGEILRYRAWCRDRTIRGLGFDGRQGTAQAESFWCPIPDVVDRIDFEEACDGEG